MESALREGGRDPGLRLIETLGWNGAQLVRADRHLARLTGSADALGWRCDAAAAEAALRASSKAGEPARLRLTLDAGGRVEVTSGPMPPTSVVWRIGLAREPLWSADPWLQVKSTRRAVYDAARAALPAGLDEVLFLNERSEVCDGTITTLFFDAGEGLCTPPLSAGLLPGVLRAEMLANGAVREAVLREPDLPHVRLWVGNSLRGLIPAVWAD